MLLTKRITNITAAVTSILLMIGSINLLWPSTAMAAGEQYQWTTAEHSAILANKGGNFVKDTIFKLDSIDSNGATFKAPKVTYRCNGQLKTNDLALYFKQAPYQDALQNLQSSAEKMVGAEDSCHFDYPVLPPISGPAANAGQEQYIWRDTDRQAINATAGNFGDKTVVFDNPKQDKSGGYTFTASGATFQCGAKTKTADLSIYFKADMYKTAADGLEASSEGLTGADGCGFAIPIVDPLSNTAGASNCDSTQGDMSWMVCPPINSISAAIINTAKRALTPLLRVNRVTPDTTPDLYRAWQGVRDLAEVLIILVFFIIIAATLLQKDIAMFNRYTVKTVLPKLAIASILIHFSFLFSGLIVDVGNVLGAGVSSILSLHQSAAPSSTYILDHIDKTVGVFTTLGAGAAGAALAVAAFFTPWTIALPMLAMIFLSILAVFITLAARFLFIAVLVVVSPLALLAWIMPGTEIWFKRWFKVFTGLALMYPIIMAIFTLAGSITQLLGGIN